MGDGCDTIHVGIAFRPRTVWIVHLLLMADHCPSLTRHFDYYGVTFDHLILPDDLDPDVLQINIIEMETDSGPFAHGGAYAKENLLFVVDPAEYAGKSVLAVPRCCQKRKGTQDRARVNSSVAERDARK